jgi:hypothetical protein
MSTGTPAEWATTGNPIPGRRPVGTRAGRLQAHLKAMDGGGQRAPGLAQKWQYLSRCGRFLDLGRPRVVENPELDEEAEVIGTYPFADDPVTLEAHDVNNPFLNCPPSRRPSQMPSRVGPAKCGPEHHRVPGQDQLFDIEVQVGERMVVSADGFNSGGRACPERIDVALAIEVGGRFVSSAIPDLLDESPHLHLAFGHVHPSPRSAHRLNSRVMISGHGGGALKVHCLLPTAGFASLYPWPDQSGACSSRALRIVLSAPPAPSTDPGI